MQCVILAGGLASRLGDLTRSLPKSLIPVAGQPFLAHQLKLLAQNGVRDIVLSIGYLGEQIRAYAGDGQSFGVKIRYVEDGPQRLGTAGALRGAFEVLAERFFVLYGDSYLPIDYQAVWQAALTRPEPLLLTIMRNENQWDASNVCFAGGACGKVTLYQKQVPAPKPANMVYIDYGLSVLRREVIAAEVPAGEVYDLATVFQRLSVRGDVAGYVVTQRFYEIGSVHGLHELEQLLGDS